MQIQMEANDLESFFLNKDKKKKSKKANIINPSLLIEQTREAELKKAKKVIEKSQQSQKPKSELLRKTKEDDEWEDSAENEVDISSLRIGMMPPKIEESKLPKENNVEIKESDDSDSDSNTKKADKSAHPWGNKMVIKPDSDSLSVTQSVEPIQPLKYIPPRMRTGDAGKVPIMNKNLKRAPNITNNEEFPSLKETIEKEDIDPEGGAWSRVKNGHSQPISRQIVEQNNVKKYIPPQKRDVNHNESEFHMSSSICDKNKSEKPQVVSNKYIPPSFRNKPTTNPSENRFAHLRDEAMN